MVSPTTPNTPEGASALSGVDLRPNSLAGPRTGRRLKGSLVTDFVPPVTGSSPGSQENARPGAVLIRPPEMGIRTSANIFDLIYKGEGGES
jgi:hypothetical protein